MQDDKVQRVLFHETIFGPIHSRRLGSSLGVNLSPRDGKVCSFDCLYCEAGFNSQGPGTTGLPARHEVAAQLEARLKAMSQSGEPLDVITFSGNGEPTLHPDFEGIIDDTLRLRDTYFPEVKISVLSNSTRLGNEAVRRALSRVDNNILKLDSAIAATVEAIDRPAGTSYSLPEVIDRIGAFGQQCIVQTMILRGEYEGRKIDNSTPEEIGALIDAYRKIGPGSVMLYSIDRQTPARRLEKVPAAELEAIAGRIRRETGLKVTVS